MTFDVDLHIEANSHVKIEAQSAEEARAIAAGLTAVVDLVVPPGAVDETHFEHSAFVSVGGVSEAL